MKRTLITNINNKRRHAHTGIFKSKKETKTKLENKTKYGKL